MFNTRTYVSEDLFNSKILFLRFQVICQIVVDKNDMHFNQKDDIAVKNIIFVEIAMTNMHYSLFSEFQGKEMILK